MKIKLSLNGIEVEGDYQKEGLMAYQARLKSLNKMGTQKLVDGLIESNEPLHLELKDENNKWKFYINDIFISEVLESKYKAVGYRMINFDHLELLIEKNKSENYKITPIIYSTIPD
ncbi:hypothetical protein BU035_00005 [Staphylococcus simulans]|uniref:hypothetical protein n=1 Tax=Staphylococcus simulans TaxID=1286 RepID=UPI000D1E2F2D|nr:hypothetical protein [Staphylococcus simulans]PTJ29455.1 hypothetical protein BU035_00005 [Staphylococcus simulans]